MNFLKRNYGWMLVAILAILPMFLLFNMVDIDFTNGLSISLIEGAGGEGMTTLWSFEKDTKVNNHSASTTDIPLAA